SRAHEEAELARQTRRIAGRQVELSDFAAQGRIQGPFGPQAQIEALCPTEHVDLSAAELPELQLEHRAARGGRPAMPPLLVAVLQKRLLAQVQPEQRLALKSQRQQKGAPAAALRLAGETTELRQRRRDPRRVGLRLGAAGLRRRVQAGCGGSLADQLEKPEQPRREAGVG